MNDPIGKDKLIFLESYWTLVTEQVKKIVFSIEIGKGYP